MQEKKMQRAGDCLRLFRNYANQKRFTRIVAGIVVFCAVHTLAIATSAVEMTDVLCGLDHEHDQSCYVATVSAEMDENALDLTGMVLHTHNEFCYDSEGRIICPLPQLEEHVHSDDCYEIPVQEAELEVQTHVHSSECYTREQGTQICTIPGPVTHVHTDACYQLVEQEKILGEAHEHTDGCYTRQQGELTCVLPEHEGHAHTDDCYICGEELICGMEENEEHSHEDSCYGKVLICETQENIGHTHADGCYEWAVVCTCGVEEKTSGATEPEELKKVLICTEEEQLVHIHSDACYGEDAELTCVGNKNEEHVHTDDCYEWILVLSCGKEELSAEYAEPSETVKVLTCTKIELTNHTHVASCYEADSTGAMCLICSQYQMNEHQHTEGCLIFSPDRLLCELEEGEEHNHGYTCYSSWSFRCRLAEEPEKELSEDPVEEPTEELTEEVSEESTEEPIEEQKSDPTADVESQTDWEETFAHVELTGAWSHDLLAIAQSQLGYQESDRNFIVSASGDKKGYTRYGDWYGVEYGDWCAMFASFCLNYAEIEDFPLHCKCSRWIDVLKEFKMYVEADACMPRPGDLVFIDYGRKSKASQSVSVNADHVAIVTEVIPATQEEPARIVTIEGNHNDCVCYETRSLEDPKIMGYGILPDGPAASYSCGMEVHTHDSDCYGEEDIVICQTLEHIHDEICRSKNLQFVDESIQVDITLTNAVYVPENLSLNVALVPEDNAPTRSELMNALENVMVERSCSVADMVSCRMGLIADGEPYQLPIGVVANIQISFKQPVFSAEAVSRATELYTFMQVEEETDVKTGKQNPYQVEVVFENKYENMADGKICLSFATNDISELAVVLAVTSQESNS